jgi:hypothetical protein
MAFKGSVGLCGREDDGLQLICISLGRTTRLWSSPESQMRELALLVIVMLCGCGMEPSNIDLGLHVEAQVYPRVVSLTDSAATLSMRVIVDNPTDRPIIVETGGPPFVITGDPTESQGLSASLRLGSAHEPLNAGPGVDWWGGSLDTIRAHRGVFYEKVVTVREWLAGWTVVPGSYRVRSYYNGREGESQSFSVSP